MHVCPDFCKTCFCTGRSTEAMYKCWLRGTCIPRLKCARAALGIADVASVRGRPGEGGEAHND